MKTQTILLFATLFCLSAANASTEPESSPSGPVKVAGVLIGPIFGPGGATTGLALYDHPGGRFIAQVRDNTGTRGRFVVDPCSTTYQPVLVTGEFKMEDLGQFARNVKVLEAQVIEENGPRLTQDISAGIASGLCARATGHAAFVDLAKAFPVSMTGSYGGGPCKVNVHQTATSITVEVQSSRGGVQTCTLEDGDPMLSENVNSYSTYFHNGAPGTVANPKACGVTEMDVRGQKIVFISTPSNDTASCSLND